MSRTRDYEYGKGAKYGYGTKVLITMDCRRWKIGGDFANRIGTVTFDELWVIDDDGSKQLLTKNYPTIKIGCFWKIKGLECFWTPLDEFMKIQDDPDNDVSFIFKGDRLVKIVRGKLPTT